MNIIQLIEESHSVSKEKGFWDEKRNNSETVLLIISNVGDIVKAHKKGRFANWIERDTSLSGIKNPNENETLDFNVSFEEYIKDTFEDEIANVMLRICDFLGGNKTDIFALHPWMREYSELSINDFLRYAQISREYPGNVSDWLCEALWECSYYSKEEDCGLTHLLCYLGSMVSEMELDIERHIVEKLKYNRTRPRLYRR
jgi:hypothetical protein